LLGSGFEFGLGQIYTRGYLPTPGDQTLSIFRLLTVRSLSIPASSRRQIVAIWRYQLLNYLLTDRRSDANTLHPLLYQLFQITLFNAVYLQ